MLLVAATPASAQLAPTESPKVVWDGSKRSPTVHLTLARPPLLTMVDIPLSTSQGVEAAIAGPSVVSVSDTAMARGTALAGPRGGAVLGPRERADAAIRQLIRRLD